MSFSVHPQYVDIILVWIVSLLKVVNSDTIDRALLVPCVSPIYEGQEQPAGEVARVVAARIVVETQLSEVVEEKVHLRQTGEPIMHTL